MLLQLSWLVNLVLVTSAAAHAGTRKGFKPRDLANGTVSGTATPTGPVATATATSTPISSSQLFYLDVASTGTIYDGQRLVVTLSKANSSNVAIYPQDPSPDDAENGHKHFLLLDDGALYSQSLSFVAGLYGGQTYGAWHFAPEANFPYYHDLEAFCKIVGGDLTCQTGPATVFYICPFEPSDQTGGNLLVGPSPEPGCTEITLIVVPF